MSSVMVRYAPGVLSALLFGTALPAMAAVEIVLPGLESTVRDAVALSLSLNEVAEDDSASAARIRYLHGRAPEEIRRALSAFSYFNPSIESSLTRQGENWLASYRVEPGTRTSIASARLENRGAGAQDERFQAWLQSPLLQPGAALDQQGYEQLKTELLEGAAAAGYYDARFVRSRIEVDPATDQAAIELLFDTGPLYRAGTFSYSESPVRRSLLERYQTFQPGDPVSTDQLLQMQRGLIDSEYFSSVEIQPHWDQADAQQRIPIDVNLTPNQRTAYRFGLGYGTDTGARLSARQDRRWVNDRGHSIDTLVRWSEVSQTFSSQYRIPGPNPLTDRYSVQGLYEKGDTDTAQTDTWQLGLQEQKYRGRHRFTYALTLEEETFSFDSDDDQTTTRLLVPELGWQLTRADNRLDLSRGYRLGVELSGGARALLSDINFVQLHASAKGVWSLNERWRLLARLEAGATGVSDFSQLPASRRFFAGGDSSVRGYGYETLGPEDSDGEVRGGRYLLVGSLEVDYRLIENWRGALFWDAGNAFDSFSTPLKQSLGVGARWQSPIGPVRLDLAKPLEDEGVRLHFTLGPDL